MRISKWLAIPSICLGLALTHAPAQATLLFAGGEPADFTCAAGSACYVSTNALQYRPAWARGAILAGAFNGVNDPPTNRFGTPTFTATSSVWVHLQYCTDWNNCENGTASGTQMIRVFDSAGNPTIVIRGTGTVGQLQLSSRTAAGVFTDLATCPGALTTSLNQIDLFVNYGSAGQIILYNASTPVCTYSGNVTNGDGATTLERVEFSSANNQQGGSFSEVIIATTDTRAMSRFSAPTAANGVTTSFSGTNVCSSIWPAIQYNDANYAWTATNNAVHECTIYSAIPAGAYSVLGLVMSTRALVGSTGPQKFNFVTRVGTTDYFSPDLSPTMSFSNISNYIQTVNPATSNPWDVTDFTASSFNVGQKAKP